MTLTNPIQVRFTLTTHLEMEATAAARGIPLSSLVRERLDIAHMLQGSIDNLRSDLALSGALGGSRSTGDLSTQIESMLGEVLETLRESHPKESKFARAEIERLGLPRWVARKWV